MNFKDQSRDALRRIVRRRLGLGLLAALAGTVMSRTIPGAFAADDDKPIVMAVFPRRQATLTTELYTPMAEYLSRELGREVRLVTAKDFEAFWDGVLQGAYDIVHYNQFHYLRSADRYRVIAHNEEFGTGTVAGALFVRKDSGITSIEQLRGKKIVFGGGTDAMMSYIMPSYLLLEAGLNPGDYEAVFAKNPPNSLISLYHRQADASGAGDILIDLPVVRNAMDTSTVTHLGMTERLRHLPWAVRKDMPAALAKRVQSVLLEMKTREDGMAVLKKAQMTGFAATNDSDYDAHRKIVRRVMPDLELPR